MNAVRSGSGGTFVYVAHLGSREVTVWRLDTQSGGLEPVQQVPVNGKVMPMAVSPDRRYLYAALRSEPYAISSFAMDPASGKLTHLADTPVPDSLVYISTDRTGRYLLGALNPSGDKTRRTGLLCAHPIDAKGVLQPARQVFRTEPKTHAIMTDPTNRYVFATSCDGDTVLRHRFDSTTGDVAYDGLAPVRVIRKSGPRHFCFSPDGRFVYLLNEYDATVYAFGYDAAQGMLNELQIVESLPPDAPETGRHRRAADIHVTPDGRFLYSSERTTHTLALFRVDAVTGRLTPNGHVSTEQEPRSFAIDPSGRYLLAVGVLSDSMTVYAIDGETGGLTSLGRYPMPKGPNWVEIVSHQ